MISVSLSSIVADYLVIFIFIMAVNSSGDVKHPWIPSLSQCTGMSVNNTVACEVFTDTTDVHCIRKKNCKVLRNVATFRITSYPNLILEEFESSLVLNDSSATPSILTFLVLTKMQNFLLNLLLEEALVFSVQIKFPNTHASISGYIVEMGVIGCENSTAVQNILSNCTRKKVSSVVKVVEPFHTSLTSTYIFETLGGQLTSLVAVPKPGYKRTKLWKKVLLQFLHQEAKDMKRVNIRNINLGGTLNLEHYVTPSLTHLDASNCNIQDITLGRWNASSLKVLDLSSNRLSEIPKRIADLKSLEVLNLSGQRVSKFYLDAEMVSQRLPWTLSMLNVSNNMIGDMMLKNLCSLLSAAQEIDLRSNLLTFLPDLSLCDMSRLHTIHLSHNQITNVSTDAFRNMRRGATIDLSNNIISDNIKNLKFGEVSDLNLSFNNISMVDDLIFSGNISHLDLSNNQISNWSRTSFHSSVLHVDVLNVSHNGIEVLDESMGQALSSLIQIDFGGNLINCGLCPLPEFQTWILQNSHKMLVLGTLQVLKCALPPWETGTPVTESNAYLTFCDDYDTGISIYIAVGVPCMLLLLVAVVSGSVIYVYRTDLLYMRHLVRSKRRTRRARGESRHGCDFDVFVSYCRQDRDWVFEILLPVLEHPNVGYSLCLHERDFRLGSFIMDNIVNCIERSRRVLLVLSKNFVKSEWCQWELRLAQHRGFESNGIDFLILVELEQLDRSELPLNLRHLMSQRTYLEWPSIRKDDFVQNAFWKRLKTALGTPLETPLAITFTQSNGRAIESWAKMKHDDDEETDYLDEIGPFMLCPATNELV